MSKSKPIPACYNMDLLPGEHMVYKNVLEKGIGTKLNLWGKPELA